MENFKTAEKDRERVLAKASEVLEDLRKYLEDEGCTIETSIVGHAGLAIKTLSILDMGSLEAATQLMYSAYKRMDSILFDARIGNVINSYVSGLVSGTSMGKIPPRSWGPVRRITSTKPGTCAFIRVCTRDARCSNRAPRTPVSAPTVGTSPTRSSSRSP